MESIWILLSQGMNSSSNPRWEGGIPREPYFASNVFQTSCISAQGTSPHMFGRHRMPKSSFIDAKMSL